MWTFGQILPVFLLLGPIFSIIGILVHHITNQSLPISYYSGSMDQMAISNIIPLQEQDRPSRQSTESRVISDMLQNIDRSQSSSHVSVASVASDSTATHSTRGDLSYVEDFSDAPWLPICLISSFCAILVATGILFGTSFNLFDSFDSQWSLYQVWISQFNGLTFLLVSYPCACATSIGFGLGMDLRSTWRKAGFIWLCILVNGLPLCFNFSTFVSMEGLWTRIAPYTGLIVSLTLYLSYAIFCLIAV